MERNGVLCRDQSQCGVQSNVLQITSMQMTDNIISAGEFLNNLADGACWTMLDSVLLVLDLASDSFVLTFG
jgi:hypothetical protein